MPGQSPTYRSCERFTGPGIHRLMNKTQDLLILTKRLAWEPWEGSGLTLHLQGAVKQTLPLLPARNHLAQHHLAQNLLSQNRLALAKLQCLLLIRDNKHVLF